MTTENPSTGGESQIPQQPKKKKRGLWWKVLLGLFVVLILLVALAPMLASTGMVRSLVLGKVNGQLAGRVEIKAWSLAWFGGQSIDGVKVFDEQNRLVLEVSRVQTPASLIALARGNYDLGKTEIQDLNLTQMEIGPDGQTNYQRIFMPKPVVTAQKPVTGEKPEAAPAGAPVVPPVAKKPVPAVKIDLSIKPLRGTIIALGADGKQTAPAIEIRAESGIEAKVGDPSQPITDRVKLVLVVGGKPAGTITLDGSATVDMAANTIQAAQKLLIEQLDLGALSPLLALAKVQGEMAGVVSGDLTADIAAADRGTIKGHIAGTNLKLGGAMLKGDVVETSKLDIPVDLTLGAGQTLSGTVMVVVDQGKIQVDTNLPLDAVKRLGAGEAPGAAGQTKVTLDVPNLAPVLNALKNSVKLREGVAVTGGSLALSANVILSEKDVKLDVPLKVEGLLATQNGAKIGPLQAITAYLAATVVSVSKGKMDKRDLLVDLTSGFATVHAAGATLETTQLTADCDLSKVKAELGQVFDLSMIRGGTIHVTLANSGSLDATQTLQPKLTVEAKGLSLDLTTQKVGERYVVENVGLTLAAGPTIQGKAVTITEASPLTVTLMGRVTHVDGATKQVMWDNEPVEIVASGAMSAAGEISGKAQLSLLSVVVKLDQLAVNLPTQDMTDLLALVKKAHITVGVPDLAKAYAMSQRFATPVAGQAPLNLAGNANLTADVSRAEKTSTFTLAVKADGIAVRRGTTDIKLDRPVTVDLLASVQTRAGADLMAQLAVVRVEKLLGDFGPAKVELTKPIVVTDVAAASRLLSDPKAKAGELGGAIRVTGNLTNMATLADALAGTKAGQPSVLPMAGELTSDNELAYTGSAIGLKSKTQIVSFAVMQDGKATFSEPHVDLVSNVTLDLASQTLAMEKVSLRLVKSDALSMDVTGSVKDFSSQRQLDGVVVTLTPDLAKVWDIVRPLMPPAKLATVGKLVLAGKQPIVVNISGSYPSGKVYAEAIKSVKVTGDFRADLIDWQQYGLKIESLAVPFTLADGMLHTVYQTPQGTKLAVPAKLNEGKLNIPDCKIDLTTAHPLLTIPANSKMVEGAKLNTVMVSMLGEKVMPLFFDPKEASGLVDLTIVKCERLPVDGSVMIAEPANDGYCEILASATNLNIGSGGLAKFYQAVRSGQNNITGNIRDAKITIAKGHVQHEMKLMMGNGDVGTHGDLVMATNIYTSFVTDLPTSMVSGWVKSPGLLKYMPERVGLTFHGPASALRLDEKFLKDLVSGAVKKQLTSGLLGGGDKPAQVQPAPGQPAPGQPAPQGGNAAEKKPPETVQGLIDLFGRPKKKK